MPKKHRFRTFIVNMLRYSYSQHFKCSETMPKSARQYFSDIFSSLWKKISSRNSVLVVSEILRHFFNMLTPDEKYFLSVNASV